MKNLGRTAAILFGVVGLSGVGAALAVGCGGDDTVIGYGNDSGADSPTSDTSLPDSSPQDGGSDSSFHFDAGPPDLSKFYLQITQTGCAWLENCCGGAANFDNNLCINTFAPENGGFLYTAPVLDPLDGGGNVSLNVSQANECFSLISALSCSAPFTSTQMKAIRDACNGAVQGNTPVGGNCQATIECQAPAHCESITGKCTAPYDAGTNCVFAGDDPLTSLSRCGRGYTGEPEFCQVGDSLTLPEAGICSAPESNGTACISAFECSSWLCDINNTGKCADSAQVFVPGASGTCSAFPFVDAGDGG